MRASVRRRRRLRSEDLGQLVHVDVVERAPALADLLLQPRLELGAQNVDLAVQDAPLVFHQAMDEVAKLLVGERVEVGKGFHGGPDSMAQKRAILQPWLEG